MARSAAPRPFGLIRRVLGLHAVLLISLAVAILVGLATPRDWGWAARFATGWDAGVALLLILTFVRLVRTRSVETIRARAAALDDAGAAVLPLSVLAAAASIAIVVGEAATTGKAHAGGMALLALGTVFLSWTFIHLIFAQHYAHEFYAPGPCGEGFRGGLRFPGEDPPDYWDFLHFSFVIGVAAQTADIQIASRRIRHVATLHSVVAFIFNTVIVALAVNGAVGALGR